MSYIEKCVLLTGGLEVSFSITEMKAFSQSLIRVFITWWIILSMLDIVALQYFASINIFCIGFSLGSCNVNLQHIRPNVWPHTIIIIIVGYQKAEDEW